jgi:tungstate transport system ATP-binding protein
VTAVLEAREVSALRGERVVATAEHLSIEQGETLAVLGPNGSGKTSLLLALATLLPMRGRLLHNGREIDDPVAFRRRCAVVFQRPLLLDRSVLDNAGLGLELRGVDTAERRRRAQDALERFGVGSLAGRPAIALSGGEAQRVSLARAFAVSPEILFLDEPFSALDPPTREALVADLARVLGDDAVTTLLVTHDRDEARALADRVAIVIDGRVRQVDRTDAVFGAPADAEVAGFLTPRLVVRRRAARETT